LIDYSSHNFLNKKMELLVLPNNSTQNNWWQDNYC